MEEKSEEEIKNDWLWPLKDKNNENNNYLLPDEPGIKIILYLLPLVDFFDFFFQF